MTTHWADAKKTTSKQVGEAGTQAHHKFHPLLSIPIDIACSQTVNDS